jgi:hypothetical protein
VVLERAVLTALHVFGAGDVSDSSSENSGTFIVSLGRCAFAFWVARGFRDVALDPEAVG